MICRYARQIDRLQSVEVLGFVDGHASVDWIIDAGACTMNLLCKGSLRHCTEQLHKTPDEHIADILSVVDYAHSKGVGVNIYLEDWSSGMKDSPEYVYKLMDALMAPSNLPQLGEASTAESGAATSPSWGRQEGARRLEGAINSTRRVFSNSSRASSAGRS